jgi:hypothetical protein
MALNVLPEILCRTKTFECFELKFSPLSTYCFRKKTSSPPSEAGKSRVHLFYLYPSNWYGFDFAGL